jgi:alcohol dehydrogenase
MRAFVLDGYGAIADHVRLAEIADPVPGPGDVRIEIHAASLNPIDFKIAHGDLKRISPGAKAPACWWASSSG